MKVLPWIFVILLLIVCVAAWFRPLKQFSAEIKTETKIKTIVKVDTLLIPSPIVPLLIIRLTDTMHVGDTVIHRNKHIMRIVFTGYGCPVVGRDWIVCRYFRELCTKR